MFVLYFILNLVIDIVADHLNDCSAEDTLLAHGPYTATVANVGILPASVSGYTW